jgi:hypothetical protein
MRNSRRQFLVTVLILSLSALAWAQDHPNGFFLTSQLSLSSGYDDNFIVESQQKQDDIVSLLNAPAFTWMGSTHRTNWAVDYQPEFEFFARDPDLNAWNHSSTFRLVHQINSTVSVDAGNLFFSTMDPTRRLANSILLLPRGRYVENAAYLELVYHMNSRTKLTFRLDNAFTTFDLQGPMAGRLDQTTTAGTVELDRALTTRQKISGTYSLLHVNPFHPEVWGSPTNVELFLAGYDYDIRPDLLLRLSGGLVHSGGITHSGGNSFTGAASLEKKLGEVWVAAAYQRYLSFFGGVAPLAGPTTTEVPFASGLTPTSVYQVIGARAWGKLSRRVGVEGSAQRALNGLDPQFRQVKGVIASVRLDYMVHPRLTVFARAEHYAENINIFTTLPFSRNRYFGGIEIALFHAPQRENPRYKHGKAPQDSIDLPKEDFDEDKPKEPLP